MAKKIGTIEIPRTQGDDILQVMNRMGRAGFVPAVFELAVANPWDADAYEVKVYYDPSGGVLMITDTGTGMDEGGLKAFRRTGGCEKPEFTPKFGRRPMGQFGFSTDLLGYLCSSYELDTWNGGRHYRMCETLDGVVSEASCPADIFEAPSHDPGTVLTLRGLNWKDGVNFRLRDLVERIRWGVVPDDNFKVYINNELVENPYVEHAPTFAIDATAEHCGHVFGDAKYLPRETRFAGIYIYVHNRNVGDPKTRVTKTRVKLASKGLGLSDRLLVRVQADALHSAVVFNWTAFDQSNPGYLELLEILDRSLRDVKSYIDRLPRQTSARTIRKQLGQMLKEAGSTINSIGVLPGRRRIDVKLVDSTPDRTFKPRDIGYMDAENRIIYLNSGHPSLVLSPNVRPTAYKFHLLMHAMDAVALTEAMDGPADRRLEFYEARRAALWRTLREGEVQREETREEPLIPSFMYDLKDLATLTGVKELTIESMVECGLCATVDGKIQGDAFIAAQQKVFGYVSLWDVIFDYMGKGGQQKEIYRKLTEFLQDAGRATEPFVRNLSTNQTPCYYVDRNAVTEVARVMADEYSKPDRDPAGMFGCLIVTPCTVQDLAKHCRRDHRWVAAVVKYACSCSLPLGFVQDGRIRRYTFGTFIAAAQSMPPK